MWFAILALLAWRTANPVTLNREQIARATAVVTASIASRSRGEVDVSKEWTGSEIPTGPLRLANLDQTDARNGREYLVPLTRRPDGSFHVTETRLPNGRPLIYPATEESRTALEALLNETRPRGRAVD